MWSNVKAETDWILDPEIPVNYVPVIGLDETYMVLNDDGTVNRYRKRVKDEAGNWVWSDVIEDDMPVSFVPSVIDDDIYTYIGSAARRNTTVMFVTGTIPTPLFPLMRTETM